MANVERVMVVTGCASGIGRGLAEEAIRRGHRVLATDIDAASLAAAFEDPPDKSRVATRTLDVRDAAAWDAVLADVVTTWGRLDVVMNVAGYLKPGRVHQCSLDDVDRHLDVNVKGVVLGTRAAGRVMAEQRHGHIVNIGSLASLAPLPGISLYVASKFAVRGFSLAAAQDLEPYGVAVSVVLPDAVQTPMLDLQIDFDEAAMAFSGRPLTVDAVTRVVFEQVLTRRPLETMIPFGRGALARLANGVPQLGLLLRPLLERRGRRAQQARRGR